ncbi:MAG: hypothetical protein CL807_06225 [Citromicrobium sp.]|jgi:hypothetical protein|nr:hypothetical protein [Citromicrobium sp.]MAO95303.1 hypothetical protein [Citromicrobium sp.]MAS84896.1 hypothetical protein [Erythrobacteraceae bacterium]MBD76478.1 hypothetical protein [Citromicrobium sp.]MBT46918.1 hypothetical protein [Citromicrobium sp.]|tara:strand:- start:1437 stop:1757 length:321 start_codon:yes stop_codon:yes gene_type:complete
MLIQGMMAVAMLLQGAQATPMTPEPIAMVETQDDPAVLINLGVQLANAGEHDAARAAFEKVRAMRSDYTLETVDGRWVDPAELARTGLKMLDNGEFGVAKTDLANR